MYPNVHIKKSHGKVFILLHKKVYVPQGPSMLGEDDVVSMSTHEGGTATVYIKHYPPETWVLLA